MDENEWMLVTEAVDILRRVRGDIAEIKDYVFGICERLNDIQVEYHREETPDKDTML